MNVEKFEKFLNSAEEEMFSMIDESRQMAAQCWCDEETKHIEMDVRLAEAFAKRMVILLERLRDSLHREGAKTKVLNEISEIIKISQN